MVPIDRQIQPPEPDPIEEPSTLSGRIHRYLTLLMIGAMVIGMGWALLAGHWFDGFLILVIIVSTFLPVTLGNRFNVYIPPELEMFACLFIFGSLFLGEFGGFYQRFWWWDRLLHFKSGILLGLVGVLIVFILNQHERADVRLNSGFTAFFAFLFAVALGAEWEVFEFALDQGFDMTMQRGSLADTMWDLILDTAGALIVSVLCYTYLRYGRKSFVDRWIFAVIEANRERFERS